MSGAYLSPISFPEILPIWDHADSRPLYRRVAAVRGLFGLPMSLFLLAIIFPGSEVPVVQKASAYIYLAFAAVATIIHQSRTSVHWRKAHIGHYVGFTVFILGNAAYSLWVTENTLQALMWAVWLPEMYVEGAVARPGPFKPFYPITALREYRAARRAAVVAAAEQEALERKRINAELAATKLELQRVNRSLAMSALAASVAHELSQPLAAVTVNAGAAIRWLSGDVIDLGEARKALNRIRDDSNRAAEVITSFRAMLKDGEHQWSRLMLSDLITESLDILSADIQKHGVVVRINSAGAMPSVQGDQVQLRQVFLNLMSNAIDAMEGIVDRPHLLAIRFEVTEDSFVTVSIEDSGKGMDTKDPDRVFDAFFTTKSKGMGMGLFISRMIVEAHGGNLRAVSQPGRTTFHVSIPIDTRPE
jgi:signal transduction histidine kinase